MSSSQQPTDQGQSPRGVVNRVLGVVWAAYVGYLLLSDLPPGPSLLHPSIDTLQDALDLSLNFWFVTPLLLPAQAPVINPVLEGLFNVVVAWALLFWGFLLDGRGQRWPMTVFLTGSAFLTNVFYLPWLALRRPNPAPPTPPFSRLERLGESRGLPAVLALVLVASVAWAIWSRPEFGPWSQRWADFLEILSQDRLAHSFVCDVIFFWLFQSWLVPDDMARRQWQQPAALWIARGIPFLGVVIYLLWRPPLPQASAQQAMEPDAETASS